jgi:RHS repeat-associated protein
LWRTDCSGCAARATLKDRWRISYLYDASGRPYGGVLTDLHPTGNETGRPRVFFCLTDQCGDVVELLNGAHEPIVAYRYDIWGNPRAGKAEAGLGETLQQRNVLRYAGYVYDDWNGLYYLQSRYYDPQTRSFLTRDPAKADGLESPYQYCSGRPVAYTDPTGMYRIDGSGLGGFAAPGGWQARVRTRNGYDPYPSILDLAGPLGGSFGDLLAKLGGSAHSFGDTLDSGLKKFAYSFEYGVHGAFLNDRAHAAFVAHWQHHTTDPKLAMQEDNVAFVPLFAAVGSEPGGAPMMELPEGGSLTIPELAVDSPTAVGNTPAWSTVRARYWKITAAAARNGEYSLMNLERMKRGLAPSHDELGVSMELHHITPRSLGGSNAYGNLQPVWPWEHAAIDPFRYYTGPEP